LHDIDRLPPAIAATFAESRATRSLEGLTKLDSLPLARKLASQNGTLRFRRIGRFPDAVTQILAGGSADLVMPELQAFQDGGLATRLVKPGHDIQMAKLIVLNAEAARGLCTGPCNMYFRGIVAMDDAPVRALEGHTGVLQRHTVQDVSPEGVASLLKNSGPLCIGSIRPFAAGGPVIDELTRA